MSGYKSSFLDRIAESRFSRRWEALAQEAKTLDDWSLRDLRAQARRLRRAIDTLYNIADGRLHMPLGGFDGISKPIGCDWSWRPCLWTGPVSPRGMVGGEAGAVFGDDVTVFHDCKVPELVLRQIRNRRAECFAPFGLCVDVFSFDGSFLSLVLDLPTTAISGLQLKHLIRLNLLVELETPIEIFCRLNVKHGPNTEQVVRTLPQTEGETYVDFDLAFTKVNAKRVEKVWVDLIFQGPQMNRIVLRDLTFARHPRAEV